MTFYIQIHGIEFQILHISSFDFPAHLGGARVAVQLRTFTGGLGMVTVPIQCIIPLAHQTLAEDGTTKDEKLVSQLQAVLEHLYFGANAVKEQNKKTPHPQWLPS